MINKKLMSEWIAALRSRVYKQGTGCLRQVGPTKRSVDRLCCLGVACHIINSKLWSDPENGDEYLYNYNNETHTTSLPQDYLKKLGISDSEELVLINMNDDGSKFHEIADYLERKYIEY